MKFFLLQFVCYANQGKPSYINNKKRRIFAQNIYTIYAIYTDRILLNN